MQAAVTASSKNTQTPVQDAVMGSLGTGIQDVLLKQSGCKNLDGTPLTIPYCQQERYMNTTYCACRNIGVSAAPCIYRPCNEDVYAYKTVQQREYVTDAAAKCPRSVVCNVIYSVGGNNNVTSGYQDINCGGTNVTERLQTTFADHPYLLVLIFVLVVLLAATLFSPGGSGQARRAGPPGGGPPSLPDFPGL